jgi:hypothetical protein
MGNLQYQQEKIQAGQQNNFITRAVNFGTMGLLGISNYNKGKESLQPNNSDNWFLSLGKITYSQASNIESIPANLFLAGEKGLVNIGLDIYQFTGKSSTQLSSAITEQRTERTESLLTNINPTTPQGFFNYVTAVPFAYVKGNAMIAEKQAANTIIPQGKVNVNTFAEQTNKYNNQIVSFDYKTKAGTVEGTATFNNNELIGQKMTVTAKGQPVTDYYTVKGKTYSDVGQTGNFEQTKTNIPTINFDKTFTQKIQMTNKVNQVSDYFNKPDTKDIIIKSSGEPFNQLSLKFNDLFPKVKDDLTKFDQNKQNMMLTGRFSVRVSSDTTQPLNSNRMTEVFKEFNLDKSTKNVNFANIKEVTSEINPSSNIKQLSFSYSVAPTTKPSFINNIVTFAKEKSSAASDFASTTNTNILSSDTFKSINWKVQGITNKAVSIYENSPFNRLPTKISNQLMDSGIISKEYLFPENKPSDFMSIKGRLSIRVGNNNKILVKTSGEPLYEEKKITDLLPTLKEMGKKGQVVENPLTSIFNKNYQGTNTAIEQTQTKPLISQTLPMQRTFAFNLPQPEIGFNTKMGGFASSFGFAGLGNRFSSVNGRVNAVNPSQVITGGESQSTAHANPLVGAFSQGLNKWSSQASYNDETQQNVKPSDEVIPTPDVPVPAIPDTNPTPDVNNYTVTNNYYKTDVVTGTDIYNNYDYNMKTDFPVPIIPNLPSFGGGNQQRKRKLIASSPKSKRPTGNIFGEVFGIFDTGYVQKGKSSEQTGIVLRTVAPVKEIRLHPENKKKTPNEFRLNFLVKNLSNLTMNA